MSRVGIKIACHVSGNGSVCQNQRDVRIRRHILLIVNLDCRVKILAPKFLENVQGH